MSVDRWAILDLACKGLDHSVIRKSIDLQADFRWLLVKVYRTYFVSLMLSFSILHLFSYFLWQDFDWSADSKRLWDMQWNIHKRFKVMRMRYLGSRQLVYCLFGLYLIVTSQHPERRVWSFLKLVQLCSSAYERNLTLTCWFFLGKHLGRSFLGKHLGSIVVDWLFVTHHGLVGQSEATILAGSTTSGRGDQLMPLCVLSTVLLLVWLTSLDESQVSYDSRYPKYVCPLSSFILRGKMGLASSSRW